MERSRQRTPIIQRSKVAAVIALVVGFGCAVFGVGGAAAGNGAYVRHVREARLESKLAGLALAHRTPAQLVLAMTPKATAVKAAVTSTPAATPAPTPAATTTPATTATSATTTTAAATTTAPATTTPTTSDSSNGAESATESAATGTNPDGTPILTDTTAGTTTTDTATTGTTTTGTTTTGTTTTGTTTTGTTTTGTTTTGTTTTSTAAPAATSTTATTTTGTTTTPCHGRCTTTTGTTGVVPAALPSTSSGTSTNFTLATSAVTQPSVATSAPTSNVASTPALPITQPTSTPTPAGTTSPSSGSTNIPLLNIPSLKLKVASHGSASHGSGATAPTGTPGPGAATAAGNTGTGPAGTAAAGTQPTTTSAKHAGAQRAPKHQASGGSGLSSPISSGVKVIDHFVKVIPTAVWVALGAAFALMLAFAGIALRSGRRARRREKEFAAISAAALTDALTGIFNRRGFTEAAERELARASRYDRPFVLAYVDVRGLKSVNDTEGHLMGDELIKTVAGLMKESGRADDVVGRIGGDEFALLLAEQTAESAGPVIRRIRARVAEARAEMEISVPWELTIGVASFPDDGKTLEELLDVSDRRLYEQRGIALR